MQATIRLRSRSTADPDMVRGTVLAAGAASLLVACGPVLALLAEASARLTLPLVVGLLAVISVLVWSCLQLWVSSSGHLIRRTASGAFLFAALLAALVVGLVWPRAAGLHSGALDWQDSLRLGLTLFVPAGAMLGGLVGAASWRFSRVSDPR